MLNAHENDPMAKAQLAASVNGANAQLASLIAKMKAQGISTAGMAADVTAFGTETPKSLHEALDSLERDKRAAEGTLLQKQMGEAVGCVLCCTPAGETVSPASYFTGAMDHGIGNRFSENILRRFRELVNTPVPA